jgi:prevent-host-death family protein
MREVGVLEAKTHLSTLLGEVERGGEIVITRHGQPVARLAPIVPGTTRIRRSGKEIAKTFRELRERVRANWPEEPEFDWKAAVEEGRK